MIRYRFPKGNKLGEKNKGKKKPLRTEKHKKKLSENHAGGRKWEGGLTETLKRRTIKKLYKQEKLAGRKKPEQCEICGIFGKDLKRGLFFDHNHETGEFRGWLCSRCNLVLGNVKDDSILLRNLAKYLENECKSTTETY